MVGLGLWFLKHGVISAVVFDAIDGRGRMPMPPETAPEVPPLHEYTKKKIQLNVKY